MSLIRYKMGSIVRPPTETTSDSFSLSLHWCELASSPEFEGKTLSTESPLPFRLARFLILAISVLTWIGCDLPERPPLTPVKKLQPQTGNGSSSLSSASDSEGGETIGSYEGDWETWDAYYIRGTHVGYSHAKAELGSQDSALDRVDRGQDTVSYVVEDQLKVRRGKSVVIQSLTQTSRESTAGKLIEFEAELRIGPVNNQFFGRMGQLVARDRKDLQL